VPKYSGRGDRRNDFLWDCRPRRNNRPSIVIVAISGLTGSKTGRIHRIRGKSFKFSAMSAAARSATVFPVFGKSSSAGLLDFLDLRSAPGIDSSIREGRCYPNCDRAHNGIARIDVPRASRSIYEKAISPGSRCLRHSLPIFCPWLCGADTDTPVTSKPHPEENAHGRTRKRNIRSKARPSATGR
jgi:hypothetical protein